MKRQLLAILVSLWALSGCGYSEDEWQAQLAKYGQLNGQYQAEQKSHREAQAELDKAKERVAQLQQQLEKMGVNLDTLNTQLQQAGSEKQELASSLDQLKQALEEYKKRAAQLEQVKARFEALRSKLQKLVNLGLKVEIRKNRMVIRLPGDVLFASGQDKLRDDGIKVLDAVADVIRNDQQLSKRYFQVAGHTDNKALKGGHFKDNWGLSVMRAREVLVHLVSTVEEKGGGLSPERLHAAGFGETDPVAPNTTDDGRKQNRRVELVLMPDVEEMLDLKSLI
ncbi:MAG: OmpA family protein [Polyangiaceae bacterium]|nr:OmpA family protein [Polyangiaceae bacterium]